MSKKKRQTGTAVAEPEVGKSSGQNRRSLPTHKPGPAKKVYLTQAVADYMSQICKIAGDNEVGGLGYVHEDEDGDLIVDEVFLVPQEVSGGHVSLTGEAIAYGMEKALADGRLEDLRFSWHSHNTMSVFWSGVDEGGIKSYLDYGAPWLLSVVTNNDEEFLARLDVGSVPMVGRATFDKLPVWILTVDRTDGRALADFNKYVTIDPWTSWTSSGSSRSSSRWSVRETDGVVEVVTDAEVVDDAEGVTAKDLTLTVPTSSEVTKSGARLFEGERQKLERAGWNPDEMDDDEIMDALVGIDLGESGLA